MNATEGTTMGSPEPRESRARLWAMDYMRKNPRCSVHEVARAANNSHMALPVQVIQDLKRSHHAELVEARVFSQSPPFNPPKLVIAPEGPVVEHKPTVPTPPPATAAPATPVESTVAQRKQFLSDLVEKSPALTGREALAAIEARFGVGMDIRYLYDTLRAARELYGIEARRGGRRRKEPSSTSTPPPLPAVQAATPRPHPAVLDETGYRVVAWPTAVTAPITDLRYQLIKKDNLSNFLLGLLAQGYKDCHIRVFREVPVKLNFSVDVG